MTTKDMAYDHPAYLAVLGIPTAQMNGSAGTSTKFAAFTTMQIKSVTVAATTRGTSADVINVVKVTGSGGTNTTTTTTAYGTMGSGAYYGNYGPAPASQVSLVQGDTWWVQKGTDATATYGGMVEAVLSPLAQVTL